MENQTTTNTTHFGFKNVRTEEKAPLVRDVFNRVSSRYNLMNDLMSFGMHRLWKDSFVSRLHLPPNATHLDMAGGTGDIAFRIAKRFTDATILLSDINASMLVEGQARIIDKNHISNILPVCTDAQILPYPTRSFHGYTIAFGIRNVTDISLALAEAYRVLKPGGQFLCLEFAPVETPLLKSIYDQFSFRIIPQMGKYVTGSADPYQYLVESIRQFPTQTKFAKMIEQAGFARVSYRSLHGGIVAIHQGWRI